MQLLYSSLSSCLEQMNSKPPFTVLPAVSAGLADSPAGSCPSRSWPPRSSCTFCRLRLSSWKKTSGKGGNLWTFPSTEVHGVAGRAAEWGGPEDLAGKSKPLSDGVQSHLRRTRPAVRCCRSLLPGAPCPTETLV